MNHVCACACFWYRYHVMNHVCACACAMCICMYRYVCHDEGFLGIVSQGYSTNDMFHDMCHDMFHDMFGYQGTKNETMCPHDMFHDMFVH
jgi:hypothetical protein